MCPCRAVLRREQAPALRYVRIFPFFCTAGTCVLVVLSSGGHGVPPLRLYGFIFITAGACVRNGLGFTAGASPRPTVRAHLPFPAQPVRVSVPNCARAGTESRPYGGRFYFLHSRNACPCRTGVVLRADSRPYGPRSRLSPIFRQKFLTNCTNRLRAVS